MPSSTYPTTAPTNYYLRHDTQSADFRTQRLHSYSYPPSAQDQIQQNILSWACQEIGFLSATSHNGNYKKTCSMGAGTSRANLSNPFGPNTIGNLASANISANAALFAPRPRSVSLFVDCHYLIFLTIIFTSREPALARSHRGLCNQAREYLLLTSLY